MGVTILKIMMIYCLVSLCSTLIMIFLGNKLYKMKLARKREERRKFNDKYNMPL